MAMLVLPEVFQRTWGVAPEPFWPNSTAAARRAHPAFTFMAEVYWDLEWTLQQQGFDYCYDKRLYDRLQSSDVRSIREHLRAVSTTRILTHTPARCRVIPVAGIKLGIGRRLCVASDAEQPTEGVERVEAPVEPKREFVEVGL
jgi:hypothetical protein